MSSSFRPAVASCQMVAYLFLLPRPANVSLNTFRRLVKIASLNCSILGSRMTFSRSAATCMCHLWVTLRTCRTPSLPLSIFSYVWCSWCTSNTNCHNRTFFWHFWPPHPLTGVWHFGQRIIPPAPFIEYFFSNRMFSNHLSKKNVSESIWFNYFFKKKSELWIIYP